jgi:hypothetical protein
MGWISAQALKLIEKRAAGVQASAIVHRINTALHLNRSHLFTALLSEITSMGTIVVPWIAVLARNFRFSLPISLGISFVHAFHHRTTFFFSLLTQFLVAVTLVVVSSSSPYSFYLTFSAGKGNTTHPLWFHQNSPSSQQVCAGNKTENHRSPLPSYCSGSSINQPRAIE